jgi:kynurenine formamidase
VQSRQEGIFDRRRAVIDLTHAIDPAMPVSIGFPPVTFTRYLDQAAGDVATVEVVQSYTHVGTHVDAPFHFIPDGQSVDALHPLALSGSAVVVDLTRLRGWTAIESADLQAWEHGSGERIGADDIVLLRTGHGKLWRDGPDGSAYMTEGWPYLGASAIDLLLERRIKALGVECPDPDKVDQHDLRSSRFDAHRRLLGAGILIVENLARLAQIPVPRVDFLALAIPLRGASGSPIRAIALLPPHNGDA